ncbi:NADH-quinone oxidoreductase subunit J (NADH dehydrogenase I subunit J) (NDH-1 subunit J) [Candidatus Glomeribacter gigasporarum BEG34]|uniref:NADH-quinone oxidoreductase subunit J n=1 Tax=Candidatus Glomeribacter gigasporarum BEG34 TaxID=1070319 RepID=G2J8N2_9BURK|nr:NADH-quinone oxidoreductase subunit J [Candidatus Glomeribacter gigasporarum]CCD29129.1 NADH-quinone oxidoreductase subunit J (NADH dehydrogenase I subunit J) (NDH-1 subunit J) [Candidatus Glomeribacter gigasporarum BEG34]
MVFSTALFYLFALVLLASASRVIAAPDPVQAALFLVLAFFNAAAVWLLLRAEFLAILLVLVYVGAVMVLFLFVVMMLDIERETRRARFSRAMPAAMIVGGTLMIEAGLVLWRAYRTAPLPVAPATGVSNARALGIVMYTDTVFALEIAGLILLVAVIAALALTLRHGKSHKQPDPAQQIRVRREERIKLVKTASAALQQTDIKN